VYYTIAVLWKRITPCNPLGTIKLKVKKKKKKTSLLPPSGQTENDVCLSLSFLNYFSPDEE